MHYTKFWCLINTWIWRNLLFYFLFLNYFLLVLRLTISHTYIYIYTKITQQTKQNNILRNQLDDCFIHEMSFENYLEGVIHPSHCIVICVLLLLFIFLFNVYHSFNFNLMILLKGIKIEVFPSILQCKPILKNWKFLCI